MTIAASQEGSDSDLKALRNERISDTGTAGGRKPFSVSRDKSSGIEITRESTPEAGLVWARHCSQKVGNSEQFLPQLYSLYKVVTDTDYNPFSDLILEGKGAGSIFKHIRRSWIIAWIK